MEVETGKYVEKEIYDNIACGNQGICRMCFYGVVTAKLFFHVPYNAGALLDMYAWVNTPLTEFGETCSSADNVSAERQA